ncbi:predicted protein [Postia placenta Mad-698-R]|nr:predicted protein [Postia placenta Mad-698-R]
MTTRAALDAHERLLSAEITKGGGGGYEMLSAELATDAAGTTAVIVLVREMEDLSPSQQKRRGRPPKRFWSRGRPRKAGTAHQDHTKASKSGFSQSKQGQATQLDNSLPPGAGVPLTRDEEMRMRSTSSVLLDWFGHPGDSPRDVRAHSFAVRWHPVMVPSEDALTAAREERRPVLRWEYYCSGMHDLVVDDEVAEGEKREWSDAGSEDEVSERGRSKAGDLRSEEWDDRASSDQPLGGDSLHEQHSSDDEPNVEEGHRRGRWQRCTHRVRLHVEVCANDLGVAKIWMFGKHRDVRTSQHRYLQFSRRIRNLAQERMQTVGAKVSAVAKVPSWRYPNNDQLRNMLRPVRQRETLDRNPLFAAHLLVDRNRDRMYFYHPHDFRQPDPLSPFTVAIADSHSLDSIILNAGLRGLALDSSWRNKNENRAAMTLLSTVNDHKHVMPGAVLLSANVQTETLTEFLRVTRDRLIARAQEIVKGALIGDDPSTIEDRTPGEHERIKRLAAEILAQGFSVSHFMIDKSLAELHAIKKALVRWDCNGGRRYEPDLRISPDLKYGIIILFRTLQRCCCLEDWPGAEQAFLDGVEALVMAQKGKADATLTVPAIVQGTKTSQTRSSKAPQAVAHLTVAMKQRQWEFIRDYFKTNWFIDEWIHIGLPSTQTRDGTWNTNNWVESAFRVFDSVFLEHRVNKRIDRLASIILNDYLPFYRFWQPEHRALPAEVVQMNRLAHLIWETQSVIQTGPHTYDVIVPAHNGHPSGKFPNISLDPLSCWCPDFVQSGKLCVHLKAANLLRRNGPIAEWHEMEYRNEKGLVAGPTRRHISGEKQRQKESKRKMKKNRQAQRPMVSDRHVNHELYHLLRHLKRANEQAHLETQRRAYEAKTGDIYLPLSKRLAGRPKNMAPLAPFRVPMSRKAQNKVAVPRFARKRGVPKTNRMHNSLFALHTRIRDACRAFRKDLRQRAMSRRGAYPAPPQCETEMHHAANADVESHHSSVHTATASALFKLPSNDGHSTEPEALWPEEHDILAGNLKRWASDDYRLRADECQLFVDILNQSHTAQMQGIIFLLAPLENMALILQGLQLPELRSPEVLMTILCQNQLSHLAELVESRTNQLVRQLVFVNLHHEHWTVFRHWLNMITPGADILAYNSLPYALDFGIGDQVAVHRFIASFMPQHDRPCEEQYHSISTSLQRDSSSCGYWALLTMFSFLLSFDLNSTICRAMTAADVKDLLGSIYTAYVADHHGVTTELLRNLFANFETNVMWEDWPTIFSPRAATQARVSPRTLQARVSPRASQSQISTAQDTSDPNKSHFAQAHVPQSPLRLEAGTSAEAPISTLDPEEKLSLLCTNPNTVWSIGRHRFLSSRINWLLEGKDLSDFVIEPYLEYRLSDLFSHIPVAERTFIVADAQTCHQLRMAPLNGTGMAPPKKSVQLWFPQTNIFEKTYLVIPWYSKLKDDGHWFLVVVYMARMCIEVYDSMPAGTTKLRRARVAYKRVRMMLIYEHRTRLRQELSRQWAPNLDVQATVPVQGPGTRHCGVYVLRFIEMVVMGQDPADEKFTFTDDDAMALRKSIALRLAEAMPDEDVAKAIAQRPTGQRSCPSEEEDDVVVAETPRASVDQALVVPIKAVQVSAANPISNAKTLQPPEPSGRSSRPAVQVGEWRVVQLPNGQFGPAQIIRLDDKEDAIHLRVATEVIWNPDKVPLPQSLQTTWSGLSRSWNHGMPMSQLLPIIWPHGLTPYFPRIVTMSRRTEELRYALMMVIPDLKLVFDGLESHPVFTRVIEGFQSHFGYDKDRDIYDSRPTLGDARQYYEDGMRYTLNDHPGNLLDYTDEAVIEECAIHLMDVCAPEYSLRWGNRVLIFGAGRLMLGMLTLAHHTGLPIQQIPSALKTGLIFRPVSDFESIWQAYVKVMPLNLVYDFEDSHQVVVPGVDLPVAQLKAEATELLRQAEGNQEVTMEQPVQRLCGSSLYFASSLSFVPVGLGTSDLFIHMTREWMPYGIEVVPILRPPLTHVANFADFGREIRGVHPGAISPERLQGIERLLYKHSLLLFRNVDVTPEQQYALAKVDLQKFDLESFGHGNKKIKNDKKSILNPTLKCISRMPQVYFVANGTVYDHKGLREHMDAALYDLLPPKVTTLYGINVPQGPRQIVRYDDDTGDELEVPLAATAFVSGKTVFDILPPELKSLAVRSRVKNAPHPYTWISTAKAKSTGRGVETEGLEMPYDQRSVVLYRAISVDASAGRAADQGMREGDDGARSACPDGRDEWAITSQMAVLNNVLAQACEGRRVDRGGGGPVHVASRVREPKVRKQGGVMRGTYHPLAGPDCGAKLEKARGGARCIDSIPLFPENKEIVSAGLHSAPRCEGLEVLTTRVGEVRELTTTLVELTPPEHTLGGLAAAHSAGSGDAWTHGH